MTPRLVSREKRQVLLREVSLWWAKLWPNHQSGDPFWRATTYFVLLESLEAARGVTRYVHLLPLRLVFLPHVATFTTAPKRTFGVQSQGAEKGTMAENNIRDLGDFNDAELEAELQRAKQRRGGGGRDGKKLWEVIIHQKDLPIGTSQKPGPGTFEFKIYPAEGRSVPWMQIHHHEIWQETAIATPKRVAKFNCADAMTDGRERCPAEAWLDRLEKCGIPGSKRMAERGKAKSKFFANVEFTLWGGGPVPEDKRGVRPFEFGPVIQKGSSREETLGLLRLLAEYKDQLTNPSDSVTVRLVKTRDTPEPLDTSYTVSVVESRELVEARGKKTWMNVPVLSPVGATPDEIRQKMEARKPLSIFTKLFTPDEVLALLADIDPMPLGSGLVGQGRVIEPPRGKFASAQEELDMDGDIPDDFG